MPKTRLDSVYSSISGQRPAQRLALPKAFEIPTALGKVLNDIGAFHCGTLGMTICPRAWNPEENPAHRINALDLDNMTSFTNFIPFGKIRQFWTTTTVSGVETGTAYWTLSPRSSVAIAQAAAIGTGSITVIAAFKDFTLYDAVLAAVCVRGFNGTIPTGFGDVETLLWTSDPMVNMQEIRTRFYVHA